MNGAGHLLRARGSARFGRRGFTLIEIMVAVTMFAAVGALIYGGFAQTARAKQRLSAQIDRYHAISVALERMVRELSTAYVSIHLNPLASATTMRTGFVGKASGFGARIDFDSLSHTRIFRDSQETDQNELSYFIANNPSGDGKVLARRIQNRVDDRPGEGGRIEILLEDVLELRVEYLDSLSKQWVESWDTLSGTGQSNRLPTQVKIILTVPGVLDPEEPEVFGTRAVLPITWAMNHGVYN